MISSTDLNVRTTGKDCFYLNGHTLEFAQRLKNQTYLVQHNKQFGHTSGFHPQTQKLEPRHPVQRNKQYHRKVLLSSFHLNGHT